MSKPLPEDALALCQQIMREGFDPLDSIPSTVEERLADEHGDVDKYELTDKVRMAFRAAIALHAAEMKSWPAITDCDRLDAAFEELNAGGIMARHHWTCCSNCGKDAMPDEFERLDGQFQGVPIRGYAFYHLQDTERAVEGGGIYLAYGSCEPADNVQEYEERSVAVAKEIQEVLESNGLQVDWDGTYDRKLYVPLVWRRRSRPPRFCEGDNS